MSECKNDGQPSMPTKIQELADQLATNLLMEGDGSADKCWRVQFMTRSSGSIGTDKERGNGGFSKHALVMFFEKQLVGIAQQFINGASK